MTTIPTCPSALSVRGEHFPCQQLEQMTALDGSPATTHDGWAHSNHDAEAIWSDGAA